MCASDNVKMKEMCDTAALWWGERIGAGGSYHNNGDNSIGSMMAGLFANCLNQPVSEDEELYFSEILSDKLMKMYEKGTTILTLVCDYGPCFLLREAAKEAGISISNFPWKTGMEIRYYECKVLASEGYGAPWETIYPKN